MTTALNDIIQVDITIESSAISRAGFGTPLFVSEHTNGAGRILTYTGTTMLTDMVTDGFLTTDPAYLQVQAALAQDPKPPTIKIGKLNNAEAPEVAMAAIEAEDQTGWYGFAFDTRTDADLNALGTWAETTNHIYIAQTADAAILAGTAGNIGEDLRLANLQRTSLLYHDPTVEDYGECAWLIKGLSADMDRTRGQRTWANKTLATITPDAISGAQRANVHAENANTYELRGSKPRTRNGQLASGLHIDVRTTVDWLDARMTEDVDNGITSRDDVPFDQDGLDALQAVMENRMNIAEGNGHILSGWTVSVPTLEQIVASDRSARMVRTATFECVAKGFIQSVKVAGRVAA